MTEYHDFFFIKVLRKMDFTEIFVCMIYKIIANNWFTILFNRHNHNLFYSTRGVKNGNPFSLALFILST